MRRRSQIYQQEAAKYSKWRDFVQDEIKTTRQLIKMSRNLASVAHMLGDEDAANLHKDRVKKLEQMCIASETEFELYSGLASKYRYAASHPWLSVPNDSMASK